MTDYNEHLDAYIKGFEQAGYSCYVPRDFISQHEEPERAVEKIALYAIYEQEKDYLRCTHAAKQLESGCWVSKNYWKYDLVRHSLRSLESSNSPPNSSTESFTVPMSDPRRLSGYLF